jgi:hypothetical protein
MSSQTGPAAAAHEASTSTARRVAVRAPQHAAGGDAEPRRRLPLGRLQTALGNQAMAAMFGPATADAAPPAPGRPLDAVARADMETRFGADLGSVRVRTDPAACDAVNALAYTVGEQIVFNAGAYAPHAQAGRALLAHELTHVLQQRPGAGTSSQGRLEGEAKRVSRALASGTEPVAVRERGDVGIAREEKPGPPATPEPTFTTQKDGSIEVAVADVAVLRYTTPANNATPQKIGIRTEPKVLDLRVETHSPADVSIDWDGVAALEALGYHVSALVHTESAQVGEQIGPSTFSYQTPRKHLTLPPSPGPHPAVKPPAVKPPAVKPPAVKPPAVKPPAVKPAPTKPQALPPPQPLAVPPTSDAVLTPVPAATPAPAPTPADLAARAAQVRQNLRNFTFNLTWQEDITTAFKGLTPADFQNLQDRLGENDMTDAFDQLTPFMATLIGTYGPVTKGKDKLTDKRVEFIENARGWGPAGGTFYRWIFDSMSIDDITLLLRRLAADKHLRDTIPAELAESLVKRGVDPAAFKEEDTTVTEGIKRGLGRIWSAGWSSTVFGNGPGMEDTYLPKTYQEDYLNNFTKGFQDALTPANVARGAASNVTLGLSDVPAGLYGAGEATVLGTIDLWNGKTGDAAEKFTPVVVMILGALAGRAVGKLATASTAEDSRLLTTRPQPGVPALPAAAVPPIRYEVRSLGKTAAGLDRYLVRDASGELAELIVDPQKRTIRATHLATGDVVTYENGQLSRGPAGLLPPALSAGPAPGLGPGPGAALSVDQPVIEAAAPTGGLAKADPVPLASGSVGSVSPLPSTSRTAAADLRVTQARDALAAANKATSAQRVRVLAAQRDLDAAAELKAEAGRSASARDLVKEQQAILNAAKAALRPVSVSQELAVADYAKALEDQKQIFALENEVARLDAELTRELNPPGGFSLEARIAGRRPGIRPNFTQPGGLDYYQKASQLNAARTKLAERVQDLTVSLKDQLAAATPGPAARPVALANARALPNEALHPVNGVPIDVTTGLPMTTADWATDHVVSRTEIARDPRWARLSPSKRWEILTNVPENYLPITREANSSKGIQSVNEWIAARSRTNPIPKDVAAGLRAADQRARAAIERFFQQNEGK